MSAPPNPLPRTLPPAHAAFVRGAVETLSLDVRIVGLAAGGSYASDTMDDYSDLDLVIAVEPRAFDEVMRGRRDIAASIGPLLASFTGEHVGEPRLLICLYAPLPLHVDLKFVALPDVAGRVEDPVVLWARDARLTRTLALAAAAYPQPDAAWIEDRFWIWVHYGASKIGRGELFEAVDFLAFLRMVVLGPLALQRAGARPQGVRRIEQIDPSMARRLEATIAPYDAAACARALEAAVDLYRSLRIDRGTSAAEAAAVAYLADITARTEGSTS